MIDELKKMKKERGYSNKKLSELSGVPVGTIQKIFSGETESPRYKTLQLLRIALICGEDVYELHDSAPARNVEMDDPEQTCSESEPEKIMEPEPKRKKIGDKTMEDYIALPEGTRVELIDGYFYDMAAPTTIHQAIGDALSYLFRDYIRTNGGSCVPFTAPTDVQLDCDDKTMVQPDVLVVCDRSKITRPRIVGAPDLIVEVVSPSNTSMDVLIKMLKYRNAGVREYWVIFPDEKMVMVYDFTKSDLPEEYTFEDKVPVAIWDGKCEVDFRKVYEEIAFMYETE